MKTPILNKIHLELTDRELVALTVLLAEQKSDRAKMRDATNSVLNKVLPFVEKAADRRFLARG